MEIKKRGGARPNTGRLKKEDLHALIKKMDKVLSPAEVWEKLAELVKEKNIKAIQTWLAYRHGQPRTNIDITSEGGKVNFTPIANWANFQQIRIESDEPKELDSNEPKGLNEGNQET